MNIRLAAVLATALIFPGAVRAQPPPPMPRDRAVAPASGTAVLKGRVVDGLTGAAIPRARVRLIGRGSNRPMVTTDLTGAFAFTKLPAARYALQAEKSGYLASRYPTGATVRARMTPLVLNEGESVEGVTIQMFRASAMSGRVVDAHGDPVEFAEIQALRIMAGHPPTQRAGQSTDDIGEFRVGRLEPGTYLLLAMPRHVGPPERPGDSEPVSARPLPTYYPGVLSIHQAQPITLERGQSVAGLELVLGEGIPTVITGTIVSADGRPVLHESAWVNALLVNGARQMAVASSGGGGELRRRGTFRLELAPGEYVLEAHVTQSPPGHEPGPAHERYGRLPLTVGTSAIESVTIVVGNGAVATGKIVFDGAAALPKPPTGPVWLPIHSDEQGGCRAQQAHVNPDWTFRVEGLMGTCTAPPRRMFGRWMLKSLIVNGEDVSTGSITFEPGQQLRDVQVVFTDRRNSITFRVADESGQATREYVALVFDVDKARWQKGPSVLTYVPPQANVDMLSPEPRAATAPPVMPPRRPETLEALAPGEYYVVAVDDIDVDAIRSVDLLERLIPSAMRVRLGEGSNAEVALRRVKLAGGGR